MCSEVGAVGHEFDGFDYDAGDLAPCVFPRYRDRFVRTGGRSLAGDVAEEHGVSHAPAHANQLVAEAAEELAGRVVGDDKPDHARSAARERGQVCAGAAARL